MASLNEMVVLVEIGTGKSNLVLGERLEGERTCKITRHSFEEVSAENWQLLGNAQRSEKVEAYSNMAKAWVAKQVGTHKAENASYFLTFTGRAHEMNIEAPSKGFEVVRLNPGDEARLDASSAIFAAEMAGLSPCRFFAFLGAGTQQIGSVRNREVAVVAFPDGGSGCIPNNAMLREYSRVVASIATAATGALSSGPYNLLTQMFL